MSANPSWLSWMKRLQAIAQTGLTYAGTGYDRERYEMVREIAAEMLQAGSGGSIEESRGLLAAESGYATPKVDVRGIVFRGDRMLLVQEKSDGLWTPPGGWADVGASPAENVVKELREEAGLDGVPRKLLAVYDRELHPHEPPFPFHIYKIFILCEEVGSAGAQGGRASAEEITGVEFFAEESLPPLSLTRITPGQVHRMFEHHRRPDLPTDFDPPRG